MKREEITKNVYDFLDNTIYKSWTWEKLTPNEKNKFNNAVEFLLDQKIVIGTKLQQESIIQGVYHAFLAGVGYTDFNWREEDEDNPNF